MLYTCHCDHSDPVHINDAGRAEIVWRMENDKDPDDPSSFSGHRGACKPDFMRLVNQDFSEGDSLSKGMVEAFEEHVW